MARKRNPESNSFIWIGLAGVAAYLAYTNGMFGSTTTTTTTGKTTGQTTAKNTTNNPIVSNTLKPLGTVVNSSADINAQAAANLAYIIPSTSAVSQAPSGYTMIATQDASIAPAKVFYLRNDIADKLLSLDQAVANAANVAANLTHAAQVAVPQMSDLGTSQYAVTSPADLLTFTGMSGFGSLGGW